MISINRDKRDALKRRAQELGISPSVVILYGVLRLLDMLSGKALSDMDRNFIGLAIGEYRPYAVETDICYTSISYPQNGMGAPRTVLAEQLSNHGLRLVCLCKAFYNVLLKCDESSIPRYSELDGFILTPTRGRGVLSLKNKPFQTSLHLSESVFSQLKAIAEQNRTSVYRMLSRTIDLLIAMEFEDGAFIANSDIIRENILTYGKKVVLSVSNDYEYPFGMRGLQRGVRLLCLLEKYGIPGKSELLYRIIRFLLLSHSGGKCAFDYLNNCILDVYNSSSLQFKNQWDCDAYMEKELNYCRFIISIK